MTQIALVNLQLPRFLDLSIPEVRKERNEASEIWHKKQRAVRETIRKREQNRLVVLKAEKQRLLDAKEFRKATRQARIAHRRFKALVRSEVVEMLERPRGPRTVGQLDKVSPRLRKDIESAIRWLMNNNRIFCNGRKYTL